MSAPLREFLTIMLVVVGVGLGLAGIGAVVQDAIDGRSCSILGQQSETPVRYVHFDKCYIKIGETWIPRDMVKVVGINGE